MKSQLIIKRISAENWLDQEPATASFFTSGSDLQPVSIAGEDWLSQFNKCQLSDTVPQQVHRLFEVARGCLVYGYFFYPLYALAYEQLFRVLETAVTAKCKAVSAPAGVKGFQRCVDWLISHGSIAGQSKERWYCNIELRNLASHPTDQCIMPPTGVLNTITSLVADINELFTTINSQT